MAANRGYRYFVDSKKYKKYILYMNKFISFASLALLASSTAFCDMMSDIVGDLTMPPPTDISQNFPYGITAKTPPYIQKILSKKGRAPYRMNLRIFQGCPTIESSKNGRLWAAYFGSNEQNEGNGMFSKKEKIFPYQPNDVAHAGQFTVIATSADGGKTWKEVFVFDPSKVLNGTSSDPLLWKDADGNIRFTVVRNMDVGDKEIGTTATWEFVMLDPESENTGWSKPRLVCKVNASVMKPLVFPDGSLLRPCATWGHPHKAYFIKESRDGKAEFVSRIYDDKVNFGEQSVILRKDGSIFSTLRRAPWNPVAGFESRDGGKTWKEVGFPEKISVATKTVLFRAKSGNIILVGNDAKIVKIENDKPEFEEVRDINGKVVKPRGLRTCMTAFISYDDGKTFPKKILLDERFTSYPSICEHDGFLYIAYDNSRTGYKHQEIMLAKITEADIEAGKLVNPDSKLKMEISAPYKHGGGVRKDDKLL